MIWKKFFSDENLLQSQANCWKQIIYEILNVKFIIWNILFIVYCFKFLHFQPLSFSSYLILNYYGIPDSMLYYWFEWITQYNSIKGYAFVPFAQTICIVVPAVFTLEYIFNEADRIKSLMVPGCRRNVAGNRSEDD